MLLRFRLGDTKGEIILLNLYLYSVKILLAYLLRRIGKYGSSTKHWSILHKNMALD